MDNLIVPRLNYVHYFEENSFKPATSASFEGKGWYIQGQFFVKDKLTENYNLTKPFYKRRKGNKDGDLGHAFPFLMCNMEYWHKHEKELTNDGYKPIFMKDFDVQSATNLIARKIKEAGDNITYDSLWHHLSSFADTEYDS